MNRTGVMGLLLFPASLLLAAATADPGPTAGLEGSKHDFSREEWTGGDRCVACHAESREALPDAPLWNPSADFNRTFADSLTRRRGQALARPGGGSLICMRCHDGTVAQDMFGGLSAPRAENKRHPGLLSTGHGSTNHPVGIEYPLFNEDFHPRNVVLAEGAVSLPDGRVECISCHDPHNEAGAPYMLTKRNERSALCLTCHKK